MKIEPVVKRAKLKDSDENLQNLEYWLSRPPYERIAAVTKLIHLTIEPGQQMDKTIVAKRKLHP